MANKDTLIGKHYELYVSIPSINHFSKDVNSLYVFRLPMLKTASFNLLSLPLRYRKYSTLKDIIKDATHFTDFPKLQIMFTVSNPEIAQREGEEKKIISYKMYRILRIKNREEEKVGVNRPVVNFYIVNDALWYLASTISFNKIGEDLTALAYLKQYENFISTTYEDYFNFIKIIEEVNEYEYEQIFLKTTNDLKVPSYLISNFKLTNVFSYYFFDEFKLDGKAHRDINCLLVSLSNKELFEKLDIFDEKYKDHISNFKQINSIIINDYFQIFNKVDPVINLRDKDQVFEKREAEKEPVTTNTHTPIKEELVPGRKIGDGFFGIKIESNDPTKHLNIYCPDDFDNGINRFNLIKDRINNKFDTIEFFELYDCHVDLIQFDRIYNLNFNDRELFLFLPISIVNIFTRQENSQMALDHSVKFQCLKFRDNVDSDDEKQDLQDITNEKSDIPPTNKSGFVE